eukprot:GHVQ01025067.1.p1 GENE.GHVQ01025067.1~~GHVQ01025067.1.p1  ORF type:complete len:568 (-),score=90.22 GHVQ01025067.1:530-2233(-)
MSCHRFDSSNVAGVENGLQEDSCSVCFLLSNRKGNCDGRKGMIMGRKLALGSRAPVTKGGLLRLSTARRHLQEADKPSPDFLDSRQEPSLSKSSLSNSATVVQSVEDLKGIRGRNLPFPAIIGGMKAWVKNLPIALVVVLVIVSLVGVVHRLLRGLSNKHVESSLGKALVKPPKASDVEKAQKPQREEVELCKEEVEQCKGRSAELKEEEPLGSRAVSEDNLAKEQDDSLSRSGRSIEGRDDDDDNESFEAPISYTVAAGDGSGNDTPDGDDGFCDAAEGESEQDHSLSRSGRSIEGTDDDDDESFVQCTSVPHPAQPASPAVQLYADNSVDKGPQEAPISYTVAAGDGSGNDTPDGDDGFCDAAEGESGTSAEFKEAQKPQREQDHSLSRSGRSIEGTDDDDDESFGSIFLTGLRNVCRSVTGLLPYGKAFTPSDHLKKEVLELAAKINKNDAATGVSYDELRRFDVILARGGALSEVDQAEYHIKNDHYEDLLDRQTELHNQSLALQIRTQQAVSDDLKAGLKDSRISEEERLALAHELVKNEETVTKTRELYAAVISFRGHAGQ